MKYGSATALCALLWTGTVIMAKADRVDDYLKTAMEKYHIPSISVAIVRHGKIEKLKSYGVANLEWNGLATTDTPYQIASATKPFTGMTLMQLVEEGKISLDDKVSKYLPDAPTGWNAITIRHLATHTSGIPWPPADTKATRMDDAIQQAFRQPLEYIPGEKAAYGLNDYVVLMRIMEKVTGKPFPEILRERVFGPLHMSATCFDNEALEGSHTLADLLPQRAGVYEWDGDVQKSYHFLYPAWTYAAGGLYASIGDMAKWAVALDMGKLLQSSTYAEMWTSQKLKDGRDSQFGVGWVVEPYKGRTLAGHSGGPALADVWHIVEDKFTIIVLTNQHNLAPELAHGIADLYYPETRKTKPAVRK